jgi:hypothetical protein
MRIPKRIANDLCRVESTSALNFDLFFKVGDTLVSVSGIPVNALPNSSLQDIVMGDPLSTVRLGFERSDKMTGRMFVYEISLQREEGTREECPRTTGEAAAAAIELDMSPHTKSPPPMCVGVEKHSNLNDMDTMQNSRQSSARRLELESFSRTSSAHEKNVSSSARRAHAVSPWPTPLSARSFSTNPMDGGEGSLPTDISITLSKSSVDPYSVLSRRNHENMLAMAAEIDVLKNELVATRGEANESKLRASEADERAKMESARSKSEEKLRRDAMQREQGIYQQWVEEQEKRKEAERSAEALSNDFSRREDKIKALESQMQSIVKGEDALKAHILKLENEARDSASKNWTLEDENRKLSQVLQRTNKEFQETKASAEELQKVDEELQKADEQLKAMTKKLQVAY